jgi:pimeloyl-ACP methyl ester carboxylesterase
MWMEPVAVPEATLKKIKSRTLIVMGDRDIITPEHGNYLNKTIPSSELYVVKDCGHYTFAVKPDEMIELARNFLDRR